MNFIALIAWAVVGYVFGGNFGAGFAIVVFLIINLILWLYE